MSTQSSEKTTPFLLANITGYGQKKIDGEVWRWQYHRHVGPLFMDERGELLADQDPPPQIWEAVKRWLRKNPRCK